MTDTSRYRAVAVAVTLLLLLPLLLTHYAPIVDYPNHLARAFILRHYAEVPSFAAAYVRAPRPIPNVAIDAIVVALQYVLPPVLAGKIFLLGVVLLWCVGCHLLGRAIHGGRSTWLAIPCMLLAYHGSFQYGFVNYALGLGLYMIGLAVWMKHRSRWSVVGVVLTALIATAAYLAHLSAYALLGVTAVAITLYDLVRRRITLTNAVIGGLAFVPPLLLFAGFMRGGGEVGRVEWNTLGGKAVAVFSMFRGYDLRGDVAFVVALVVLSGVAVVAAWRAGRITAFGGPLVASLVLFALFLACPKDLFTSGGADVRVVPAAVILFILSWRIELPRRYAAPLLAAVGVVMVARLAMLAATWSALDERVGRSVALLQSLPEGARMLPLFTPSAGLDAAKRDRVLEHAPYYAIITRHAYVPILFASRAQQPLVARRYGWSTITAEQLFATHLAEFDYVWAFQPPAETAARLLQCCDSVAADGGIALWRVRPAVAARN